MQRPEFDAHADAYQLVHSRNIALSGEAPEYFHRYKVTEVARLLSRAGTPCGLRILDFGCGVGNSLPHFEQQFPECELTGIDVSQESLKAARQRASERVRLVHSAPSEPLPFASSSFDLVFAACVLHHMSAEQQQSALAEWWRVLASGGSVFVFEHNPRNPFTVHAVNTCEFDRDAVLIAPRRLVSLFRAAGFPAVERRYCVFFPRLLSALRTVEPRLGWLPVGAQYYVRAKRI